MNRILTITAIILGLMLAALCVYGESVRLTWPSTGATNSVMLDGVLQLKTAGTNATVTVTNDVDVPVTVQVIGGGKCYTAKFSIGPVARWTGQQEFAEKLAGPWLPVTLTPGARLTGPGGFFRAKLTKQLEVEHWWNWATREGKE